MEERSMHLIEVSIGVLPQEVLLSCVAEFLTKRERYKLFSLCTSWKPLLYECRTIFLANSRNFNETDWGIIRYSSNPFLWHEFTKSAEHRQKLLNIIGVHLDNNSSYIVLSKRKWRLKITFQELAAAVHSVLPYIEYFYAIEISYDAIITSFSSILMVLQNPTSETLNYCLQRQWMRCTLEGELQAICDNTSRISQNEEMFSSTRSTFQSLRGVNRLWSSRDGFVFVEMHPDINAKLQAVELNNDIRDSTCLKGIPKISLANCSNLVDVSHLSEAQTVQIYRCSNVRDLAALSNVHTVTLTAMQLDDISMLGNVYELTLQYCKIKKFPTPSFGKGQSWTLSAVDIADMSRFANLEKLTLNQCTDAMDYSMLSQVKFLDIQFNPHGSRRIVYPVPRGRGQEWTFTNICKTPIVPATFAGLHRLAFKQCHIDVISGFLLIHTLQFLECNIKDCVITNVSTHTLAICNCKLMSDLSLQHDVCIEHLEIASSTRFQLRLPYSSKAMLQSLRIKNSKFGSIIELYKEDFMNIDSLTIEGDEPNIILQMHVDAIRHRCRLISAPYIFDNFAVRSAVRMWYMDETRAILTYGEISTWNVSKVTDMKYLFYRNKTFNSNIDAWDVNNVTDFSYMFCEASAFNQPLNSWNVNNASNLAYMFHRAASFNQPLNSWGVSKVTNLNGMFSDASSFNQPLKNWNVHQVTNMEKMFHWASAFNQPLDSWDVSNVTNMGFMFAVASFFNQPLNGWNVSNTIHMYSMFTAASCFDQPLNNWDVSSVENMSNMFDEAGSFNQPLDSWNVSRVSNIGGMFYKASAFNQPLNSWNISKVTTMNFVFTGSGLMMYNTPTWKRKGGR